MKTTQKFFRPSSGVWITIMHGVMHGVDRPSSAKCEWLDGTETEHPLHWHDDYSLASRSRIMSLSGAEFLPWEVTQFLLDIGYAVGHDVCSQLFVDDTDPHLSIADRHNKKQKTKQEI